MNNIADNIDKVMHRIAFSVKNSRFSATKPCLLAVSKGHSSTAIRTAYQSGLRNFGENYLVEALEKIQQLADLTDISWHFLGPIQSNKTRLVAKNFAWAHSVDRLKIAQRLSAQRPAKLPPLNLCLQVNIDNDPNKSGISAADATELAIAIAKLPNLKLRGLMCIPQKLQQPDAGTPFRALRALLDQLKTTDTRLQHLDSLSMGMSADFESAIAEGSTLVRVGTHIFGPRKPQHKLPQKG